MTRSDIRAAGRLVSALAVLPVLVAGGCAGTKAPTEIPSGPHPVIVLAIEGLRADRLGAYGAAGRETPNLDALARESVVFAWAFAQAPEAAPSLASLLTGLYPGTHGVRRTGDRLPGEARTLAELLSASGHETAAFVDGEGLTADLGFAQGFATFEARGGAGLAETGARAIGWMRERAGGDFLLLVAVGAPARGGTGYGGAVAAADRFLGEFRKAFGEAGLENRATLVVLAPCGADLGEHGAGEGPPLHATVTRVPLLVRFPGAVRAGRVGEYVEIVDVPAMLLDVSGEPVPVHLHGRSPLPLIREEGKPPYAAFGESPHRGGQQFVALGGYRLIRSLEDGRDEVYHLAEDPLEERDVAVEERRRTEALAGHLAAWSRLVASSSLDPEKPPAPLDDTTLEKLKSLGYVQ